MLPRTIFHLDMDQFFVAVELLHHPQLRGKPVAVGGSRSGRGIISTASYEARKFGLHSGMSSLDAMRLCPQIIFIRTDFDKYSDASKRVFSLLHEFSDRVQPVSVDEAYLDVTDVLHLHGGVENLAMRIKSEIRMREGLTATIGCGVNKLVAKMASGMHKPDGFTWLPPEKVAETFRNLPVGDLYGVGKSTRSLLEGMGIMTVGQLAGYPVDILRRRLGKFGDELHAKANGRGSDIVVTQDEADDEKSVSHETTFSRDLTDASDIAARLQTQCERVSRRMRRAEMFGRTVTLKLRYHGFETISRSHKLQRYLQNEFEIYPVARKLFDGAWEIGRPVRLIGIGVSDLVPGTALIQQELFNLPVEPTALEKTCDEIKNRFGDEVIGFGAEAFPDKTGRRSSRRTYNFNPFHAPQLSKAS